MDILIGVMAVAIGALFCFRGYLAMRVIIPVWGSFVGFLLGAGLVASITDEGFLSTFVAWLVGVIAAVAIGAIAYLYYEVSVAIALAGVAIAADLPAVLLVVLTALAGASTIVSGLMLLVGTIDLADLDRRTTEVLDLGWWWYALEVALALAGAVAQGRDAMRRTELEQVWRSANRPIGA